MNSANVCVVLVEPQGSRNVGSICRAMKNFDFCDLRLVRPQADYLSDEARRMAVKSEELLDKATLCPSLRAALADCRLAFGTTRRYGRYRSEFFHPDEAGRSIAALADDGKVALVFGREDHGLATSELDLCQRFITIPTSEVLPSMNIAQAVCLCLYEVARAGGPEVHGRQGRAMALAPGEECEAMYEHMRETLFAVGYLNPQNPDHIVRAFRRIFGRQGLTAREVAILRGLWSKIDWLDAERRRWREEI